MMPILKLRSFLLFFVGDHGKLILKFSQMLVVCICYCYNLHIFLKSSQKYNSDPDGCPVDWQDLMVVLAVQ